MEYLKVLKGKIPNNKNCILSKQLFQDKGRRKTFSDMKMLKEFITSKM